MNVDNRLTRLEKKNGSGKVKQVLTISYGMPADGLYHGQDRTYTEEEKTELEKQYQLIIVCYGDWPPAGRVLATIGDIDFDRV